MKQRFKIYNYKKQYIYIYIYIYTLPKYTIYITVEFETLCSIVDKYITPDEKKNFHEYLRSSTNSTQNIYRTEDNTLNSLKL